MKIADIYITSELPYPKRRGTSKDDKEKP